MSHENMSETLAVNSTISHYRIVKQIGAGGMGEVYLAEDTRLNRKVAIKLLPANFAADDDRVRRFEQEARAAGMLNHPNILTVYDAGKNGGSAFIVTELLEGEELREHLDGSALPVRKAIDYARQIAAGLSAAHEKGIIHRDLKPENIFVTKDGRVKILDFGLAKLKPSRLAGGVDTEAPTQKPLTDPGVIMGTVGYMSPEQVRGQESDHRSDIFSFGAILYEMLAGKRAFQRETMAETMTAILKEEPPELSETNAKINPALEKIVCRCLEKARERRFQTASDLGFALEALSAPSVSSGNNLTTDAKALIEGTAKPSAWRGWLAWIGAGVLGLALLALSVMYFNRSTSDVRAMRLSFTAPPNLALNDAQADYVVISPDGQKIAFTATTAEGKTQLWVRSLDSLDAKPLPGSDDAIEPFWSPDSRSIAFGSRGKLKRVDLGGGAAQILCDAARLTGGAWSDKGVIVFGSDFGSTLFQVPATGGTPKPVFKDAENIFARQSNPAFLPDGKHFLFRIGVNANVSSGVWVGSLDSQEVKQVLTDNTNVAYAQPGWLVFVRNQALVAQAFDAGSLELKGEAIPIATRTASREGSNLFSVSDNGVLVWQGYWERDYQLLWFDREEKQTGTVGAQMKVTGGQEPNLSPDGKRLVIKREGNIWVIDLARDIPVRLTSVSAQIPIWAPDGSRVAYSGGRSEGREGGIVQKAASGVGEEEMLLEGVIFANDWSPDGRFILFGRRGEKTRADVWALPLTGDRREYSLLNSAFDERQVQFSPDGRWLAYASEESGSYEIYVQSFTADGKVGGDRKRVSTNGGMQPRWRGDGQELFYIAEDGQLMSVAVKTGGAEFEYSAARALFKTRMQARSRIVHEYDVTADGQRFLIGTLMGEPKTAPPVVILNWTADLKK